MDINKFREILWLRYHKLEQENGEWLIYDTVSNLKLLKDYDLDRLIKSYKKRFIG